MGTSSGAYESNHECGRFNYRINKTRFLSFFVYGRQSRDRFRIDYQGVFFIDVQHYYFHVNIKSYVSLYLSV